MPTGAYTIDPNNATEPQDTRYVADMPAEIRALKGKVNGISVGGGGTVYYANIADFGAVADFVPAAGGGGTGTDNATAVMNAIATGKDLYIPAGNYYVSTWAARYAYSRTTVTGPGKVWGDTGRGKQILGKTLFIGATNTHELSYAGGVFWAPDGSFNGIRQWTGHHNWMVFQPDAGPMQLQLYPGGEGQAITASCEAPNKLNAVYGTFDTSLLRSGMHIGWNGKVYKVDSVVSGTQLTVTTFSGGSPGFVTSATQRAFYCFYEYSRFQANVAGTTVTRLSGDALPYGYSGDHMFCLVNGNYYAVTQGPESTGNASTLTLGTSAGTLTGASCEFFRTYGPWAYVTLFRLQGVAGSTETNGGMALNIKNELRIFNGSTHGELIGPIKLNAPVTAIGPGDGSTDDELVEVGSSYVTIGGRPGTTTRNYFEMDSLGHLIAPILKAEGPGANIPMVLAGKGDGAIQLGLKANYLLAVDAGTGLAPAIASRGSDANTDLGLDIKGNGTFRFTAGTFGRTVAEIYAPASSTSWPTMSAINGTYAAFGVAGAAANIDVRTSPKGAGLNLQFGVPAVSLSRAGALTFANNSGTTIPWDTELSDPKGMHAPGAAEVTAPVAGVYSISAGFQISATSDANGVIVTALYLLKNNVAVRASGVHRHRGPNSGVYVCGSNYTTDIVLAAGDTVAIQGYYGGASATASLDTSFTFTTFDVRLVTAL